MENGQQAAPNKEAIMNRRFNLCTVVLVGLCMQPGPGAFAQTTLTPDQYEPNNTINQSRYLGQIEPNDTPPSGTP